MSWPICTRTPVAPVLVDPGNAIHRGKILAADLDHVQKDVVLPRCTGGHFHSPLAQHGQFVRLQIVGGKGPVRSCRPELFSGPAHRRQPGIGGQDRLAEHPALTIVGTNRVLLYQRLPGGVQQPVLAIGSLGACDAVKDEEVLRQNIDQLPSDLRGLLPERAAIRTLGRAMLVASGGIASHVDVFVVRLERPDDGAQLPVLAAVIAGDLAAPVVRGRFARLLDHHAVMGHGLREVVR